MSFKTIKMQYMLMAESAWAVCAKYLHIRLAPEYKDVFGCGMARDTGNWPLCGILRYLWRLRAQISIR